MNNTRIEPTYYTEGGLDVITYMETRLNNQAARDFCRGNILKYVTRYDRKNGIEDLRKSMTYIQRLVELYERSDIKIDIVNFKDKAINFDIMEYIYANQGFEAVKEYIRGQVLDLSTRYDYNRVVYDLKKAERLLEHLVELELVEIPKQHVGDPETFKPSRYISNHVLTVKGVKEFPDATLYQCKYTCTCGDVGKRYVKEDEVTTSCHKCHKELLIYPSTENDAHDKDYNYFYAGVTF